MASSNSPASNQTTLYGQLPSYVVSRPIVTIAAAASTVATSATYGATQAAAINNVISTFLQLGWWATS